jgi:hypothetical protein
MINSVIAEYLANWRTVTYLDLSNNNLQSQGLVSVAGAIVLSQVLTTFVFANNRLGSGSSSLRNRGVQAFASALKMSDSLTSFDISQVLLID